MPKHKRYCPDCGSLMDIRGECECHHPRAICPLFRGLTKTLGNHFILCARQDGAVIQAREFASMPETNSIAASAVQIPWIVGWSGCPIMCRRVLPCRTQNWLKN